MEWLFGLALLPLLLCGAMCAGGAVLALLGVRRARQRSCQTVDRHGDRRGFSDHLEQV